MKSWKKIAIGAAVAVLLSAIVGFTVYQSHKNLVTVQTGKAQRQDLSSVVSASGEIKPKTYVNIGANAFGKIVKLYVKEGDRVKKGQLLAQLENVQSGADVAATRASLEAARTDAIAADAGLKTAMADLNRAKADAERTRLDWERAQGLFKEALIAKSEYDTRKAAWESAEAGLAQAEARIAQSKAQSDSAEQHISQNRATLTHTSEVKVDETDIVNVSMGQPAEITVDAIPKKVFNGVVTEIGNNAMVRSTGLATAQQTSTSQEAKDFKVVVTVQDPPQDLRPGLSATAKITTATRKNALAIPIQALTVRRQSDLVNKNDQKGPDKNSVEAAAPRSEVSKEDKKDQELHGVFVIRNKKAEFVPVETGTAGTTDLEVLKGLQEGDQIITGSYKVLRTVRPGASVKVDNSAPKKEDEGS